MDKCGEARDVGGIEDDDGQLAGRTVPLDLLAQVPGDLAVVLAQVLPGHASTAGSASRGDDVGGVREGLRLVYGPGHLGSRKRTVIDLIGRPLERTFQRVVHGDPIGGFGLKQRLHQVGADGAGGAQNGDFLVGQIHSIPTSS